MDGYVKLRKTLSSKSKKSKTSSRSSSSPRSTAPDVDVDFKLAAQLLTVNKYGPKVGFHVHDFDV